MKNKWRSISLYITDNKNTPPLLIALKIQLIVIIHASTWKSNVIDIQNESSLNFIPSMEIVTKNHTIKTKIKTKYKFLVLSWCTKLFRIGLNCLISVWRAWREYSIFRQPYWSIRLPIYGHLPEPAFTLAEVTGSPLTQFFPKIHHRASKKRSKLNVSAFPWISYHHKKRLNTAFAVNKRFLDWCA